MSLIFAIAIVMGAGPGLYLVNPDPNDPQTNVAWLGVPVIYAWVMLWFLVQAGVIVTAYFRVWTDALGDEAPTGQGARGRNEGHDASHTSKGSSNSGASQPRGANR